MGRNNPGKRDGTGSASRKVGRRRAAGMKCPVRKKNK